VDGNSQYRAYIRVYPDANGKIHLLRDYYSKGYYERMTDSRWENLSELQSHYENLYNKLNNLMDINFDT
jgi:hypothetical protein